MIQQRYVVICDYCGKIIGTYGYDPTKDKDGIKGIATYDGHHFCNKQCLDYFTKKNNNHDKRTVQQSRRYS